MTTMHEGLRYTRYGSPDVERRLGRTMAKAANLVTKHFDHHECRALLLIGGYGRGEGGVNWENGEERPHNNIDFLLVTSVAGGLRAKSLKRRLDEVFEPIIREERIGIDTGVVSESTLRHTPPRIIFFDLRWGHRTILGDASLVPSLASSSPRDIEISDVHNLLVNRASLLVINDAIVERGFMSDMHAQFIIKHVMKAIIGHGDVLLFARDLYHASYVEKQRRMRECENITPGLAELYETAAEFRFAPDYARYNGPALGEFMLRVRDVLSHAHLEFERFRSKNMHCTFDGHAERVLYDRLQTTTMTQWAKRILSRWRYPSLPQPQNGLSEKLGRALRDAHPRTLLAATLPAILYETTDNERHLAQVLLGAPASTPSALRNAYLRHWSMHGDPNFGSTAKRLGLSANSSEGPS